MVRQKHVKRTTIADTGNTNMSADSEIFSSNIKRMLKELDISARKLAKLAQLNHNTVHLILQDKNVPSLDTAIQLAKALGVSIDDLLGASHSVDECNRRVQAEWKKQRTKG